MENFGEMPQINPEVKDNKEFVPAKNVPITVKIENERYKHYFENYTKSTFSQINIDNIVTFNRSGVFLYEVPGENEEKKLIHVIWIYNNPDHTLPIYEPIPAENWKNIAGQPELIDHINLALIESSNQATNFYKWNTTPRGFVVEGSKNFGLEAGNFTGIRVSYEEIKPLIDAIKIGDMEEVARQQKYLASSIVHELTHLERNDGLISQMQTEIASHISQFIFDPHNNEVFNKQLAYSLKRIEKNRSEEKQKPLNLYDKAQFAALLIVADKLAEYSETVKHTLETDSDPHKIPTLKRLGALIGEHEQKFLIENVLPTIMKLDNNELLQIVRDIEIRYDIKQDVTKME